MSKNRAPVLPCESCGATDGNHASWCYWRASTGRWRKSSFSFSNGNCVEVAGWRTASGSLGNGECVEVASGQMVAVRDSKDPAGPVLAFSPAQWRAFAKREGR